MSVCVKYRIPLSQFLGWAEHDQAAALAYEQWSGQRCPDCGFHPDDLATHRVHVEHATCLGCLDIKLATAGVPEHLRKDPSIKQVRQLTQGR